MKLRTLTALLSTGALALTLAACGETDKEDTGAADADTDVDPDNDDDDCTGDETFEEDEDCYCEENPDDELCQEEEDVFEVDAVYFQYEVSLNGYDMVPYLYDGEEYPGFVYVWFVDSENWEGTEDVDNGCVVLYDLTDQAGTADAELNGGDYWWGWEIDPTIPESENEITSLAGWTESCDEIGNLDLHPAEIMAAHTWGFGVGPMGADLNAALADVYADDWAQYEPSAFGGYVNIDGEVGELSYGLAFGIDSDNNLTVNDDNTLEFIEVGDDAAGGLGYFRAFPAYGLDATAL